MEKRTYTREEKIQYFIEKIAKLTRQLHAAKYRLQYIQSIDYQEWESDLENELLTLKKTAAQK